MYDPGMDLPPLNALRSFEAAARQLSFTRAAQELHVTQTAVSHQMRLLEEHPSIDLRLVATERAVDFTRESVDVGIRWGYGRWAGLHSEKLMDDEYFPVCSPALLPRRRRLQLSDLGRLTLLHDDSPDDW